MLMIRNLVIFQPVIFGMQLKMNGLALKELIAVTAKKLNSVALVHERTIPTEQPPLVSEVSTNFCGWRVSRGQRNGSPRPYSRLSRPVEVSASEEKLFLAVCVC
jgi:hypothetical protein